MKKDVNVFLGHILESIESIEAYVHGLEKDDFLNSEEKQDAVIRRIEIIGEATRNIPSSFRKQHAHIPWKDIAGMRDKLAHDYFGVSLNVAWEVVKNDLPKLKRDIKKLVEG